MSHKVDSVVGKGVLVDGATKRQVALLATGIGGVGGWGDTEVIVSVNHLLKEWDVPEET